MPEGSSGGLRLEQEAPGPDGLRQKVKKVRRWLLGSQAQDAELGVGFGLL